MADCTQKTRTVNTPLIAFNTFHSQLAAFHGRRLALAIEVGKDHGARNIDFARKLGVHKTFITDVLKKWGNK